MFFHPSPTIRENFKSLRALLCVASCNRKIIEIWKKKLISFWLAVSYAKIGAIVLPEKVVSRKTRRKIVKSIIRRAQNQKKVERNQSKHVKRVAVNPAVCKRGDGRSESQIRLKEEKKTGLKDGVVRLSVYWKIWEISHVSKKLISIGKVRVSRSTKNVEFEIRFDKKKVQYGIYRRSLFFSFCKHDVFVCWKRVCLLWGDREMKSSKRRFFSDTCSPPRRDKLMSILLKKKNKKV